MRSLCYHPSFTVITENRKKKLLSYALLRVKTLFFHKAAMYFRFNSPYLLSPTSNCRKLKHIDVLILTWENSFTTSAQNEWNPSFRMTSFICIVHLCAPMMRITPMKAALWVSRSQFKLVISVPSSKCLISWNRLFILYLFLYIWHSNALQSWMQSGLAREESGSGHTSVKYGAAGG